MHHSLHLWKTPLFLTFGLTLRAHSNHKFDHKRMPLILVGVRFLMAALSTRTWGSPSLMAHKLPENEQTHCLFQFAFTPPAPLGLDAIVQKCRRVFVFVFPLIALLVSGYTCNPGPWAGNKTLSLATHQACLMSSFRQLESRDMLCRCPFMVLLMCITWPYVT